MEILSNLHPRKIWVNIRTPRLSTLTLCPNFQPIYQVGSEQWHFARCLPSFSSRSSLSKHYLYGTWYPSVKNTLTGQLSPDEAAPKRTRIHQPGRPSLEPYKEHLIRRWNEGCRNAQLLYREIQAAGYPGGSSAVGRFIAPWRALKGQAHKFKSVEPKPETMIHPDEGKNKRPPTALQVAHWITFKEEQRLE